jgi:hypothetical protein
MENGCCSVDTLSGRKELPKYPFPHEKEIHEIWSAIARIEKALFEKAAPPAVEGRPIRADFATKDGVYFCVVEMSDGTARTAEFMPATEEETFRGEYEAESLYAALTGNPSD